MEDHLDTQTEISAGLTETGVELKARSRFIAAIDRLGGNLFELINAPIEARNDRKRAMSQAEVAVIEATMKAGIKEIEQDPAFARRVLEHEFKGFARKRANVDGVVREALEDLRHHPAGGSQSSSGPDELESEFLDNLEARAERASTDQLKQKWGRVFSAEVRRPGTFNNKTFRVIDEIDVDTARLFEDLCKHRVGQAVPKCLSGSLQFDSLKRLVMADLLIDPGIAGHVVQYIELEENRRGQIWFFAAGAAGVGFSKATPWSEIKLGENGPLQNHNTGPSMPVYLLTDAGMAIASIFPQGDAFTRYVECLSQVLPKGSVVNYSVGNGRFVEL